MNAEGGRRRTGAVLYSFFGVHSFSKPGGLAPAFNAGRFSVFSGLPFAVSFADLLLDFFGDEVDRGVEIAFVIFGVKIGAGHGQAHGTFKLPARGFGRVV